MANSRSASSSTTNLVTRRGHAPDTALARSRRAAFNRRRPRHTRTTRTEPTFVPQTEVIRFESFQTFERIVAFDAPPKDASGRRPTKQLAWSSLDNAAWTNNCTSSQVQLHHHPRRRRAARAADGARRGRDDRQDGDAVLDGAEQHRRQPDHGVPGRVVRNRDRSVDRRHRQYRDGRRPRDRHRRDRVHAHRARAGDELPLPGLDDHRHRNGRAVGEPERDDRRAAGADGRSHERGHDHDGGNGRKLHLATSRRHLRSVDCESRMERGRERAEGEDRQSGCGCQWHPSSC